MRPHYLGGGVQKSNCYTHFGSYRAFCKWLVFKASQCPFFMLNWVFVKALLLLLFEALCAKRIHPLVFILVDLYSSDYRWALSFEKMQLYYIMALPYRLFLNEMFTSPLPKLIFSFPPIFFSSYNWNSFVFVFFIINQIFHFFVINQKSILYLNCTVFSWLCTRLAEKKMQCSLCEKQVHENHFL